LFTCSLYELCQVVGARPLTDEATFFTNSNHKIAAFGVAVSSREVQGGELFIALPGAKSHGNSYTADAYQRGAALVLLEHTVGAPLPDLDSELLASGRVVAVPDTLQALHQLAAWWRSLNPVPIVAVTGSVGKTTVKELIAAILLTQGSGFYSQKSYNNHVGVPLTIFQMGREHHWGVVEIGMNNRGEISPLSKLTAPQVTLVTAVSEVHIGNLGSLAEIAREKFSILDGLRSFSTGVQPVAISGVDEKIFEDPQISNLLASYSDKCTIKRINDRSFPQIFEVKSLGLAGLQFQLAWGDEMQSYQVTTSLIGLHNIHNEGLKNFIAPVMRLKIKTVADGRKIVDDSYNASPISTKALIAMGGELKAAGAKVGFVFGEMYELGEFSRQLHAEVAAELLKLEASFVLCVGGEVVAEMTSDLNRSQSHNSQSWHYAASNQGLAAKIYAAEWDILLVKGSRGVGLDRVVEELEVIESL
jgi:UDP-N-acetylmuramoyl-tripeptide--D-alanyl-D-alanine ligase